MTRIIIARVTRENIKRELNRLEDERIAKRRAEWGILTPNYSGCGCIKCGGRLQRLSREEMYCEDCGRVC